MAANSFDHPYEFVRSVDGRTAWVSGITPRTTDGTMLQDRDEAIAQVLATLRARVEAAGWSLGDVVKTTVFLLDLGWRDALNHAYLETFPAPMPARSAIQVVALPGGAPIEIEAVLQR